MPHPQDHGVVLGVQPVAEHVGASPEGREPLPALVIHRSAHAGALLEQVGLGGLAERYPETLSGGEQQRVAIARALAHEPAVLLADEPTGNLDEETGSLIIALLTDLARLQGTTLLLVTHSMQVAGAADRVLRLGHGRVTDVSTP